METKTWHFDFILEGVDREDANVLLTTIILMVDLARKNNPDVAMAGGFHEETEGNDVQKES